MDFSTLGPQEVILRQIYMNNIKTLGTPEKLQAINRRLVNEIFYEGEETSEIEFDWEHMLFKCPTVELKHAAITLKNIKIKELEKEASESNVKIVVEDEKN
jgi:hypothetical protein